MYRINVLALDLFVILNGNGGRDTIFEEFRKDEQIFSKKCNRVVK